MSTDIDFQPGQVWRVKSRPQDKDPHVAVLAVHFDLQLGTIVSIAMTGVHIRNAFVDGGVQTQLPHAPISAESLAAAVSELVAENGPTAEHPGFAGAYQEWQRPFEKGEAGVFTISLSDILDLIEQAAASHG